MKLGVINQENIKDLDNLFKQFGISSHHTDFSLLTGGDVTFDYLTSKSKKPQADYWTDIKNENNLPMIINSFGEMEVAFANQRNIGIRLVAKYSDFINEIIDEYVINGNISEVTLGSYPTNVCDYDTSNLLEKLYRINNLSLTPNTYLINENIIQKSGFIPKNLDVYEYLENYYVRIISNNLHPNLRLSNGMFSNNGEFYWIKVPPLVWYLDKENDIMLTKDVIVSGIPYRINQKFYDNEESFLSLFVNERLMKDILGNSFKKVKEKHLIKKIKL